MPSSKTSGKTYIKKYIKELGVSRVLDIGVGRGTYGILLDNEYDMIGVDVVDYSHHKTFGNSIKTYYDEYHICDMRDTDCIKQLGQFDLIIMGDVLEHISVEESIECLTEYKKISKYIIVAVPYLYPQKVSNNHYEDHIQDDLTNEIFLQRYPEFELIKSYNEKGVAVYGYYIWKED